jgi:hypothetical protein
MQQLRLIGLSSLLTILIWVVADNSLSETASLKVILKPVSGAGEAMRVALLDRAQSSFEVTVTGKKTAITGLKSREPLNLAIQVANRDSGDYTLYLLDELVENTEELSEVMVQGVDPPSMRIQVDWDITVKMPVFLQRGTLRYDFLEVDPKEVDVKISELAYNALNPADRRVVLKIDDYLETAPRGKLASDSVPITPLIGDIPVTVSPGFVNIQYNLVEQLQELVLPAVPIKIEATPDIFNEFDFDVKEATALLTQSIKIKGPPKPIERIRAGEIRISGQISLSPADKAEPGRFRYATPKFNLPEGVELVSDAEQIEFRLIPRKPAGTDTQ